MILALLLSLVLVTQEHSVLATDHDSAFAVALEFRENCFGTLVPFMDKTYGSTIEQCIQRQPRTLSYPLAK